MSENEYAECMRELVDAIRELSSEISFSSHLVYIDDSLDFEELLEPYCCEAWIDEEQFQHYYPGFSDTELRSISDHYFQNPDCMAPRSFSYDKDFQLLVNPTHFVQYVMEYFNSKQLDERLRKLNFYNIETTYGNNDGKACS